MRFHTLASVALLVLVFGAVGSAIAANGDCAQPQSNGARPVAADCLFVLKAAVGSATCDPECICDADGSGRMTASDALLCLRVAVGQPLSLACSCEATTTTTMTTVPVALCGNGAIEPSEPCDPFASPSGCPPNEQCVLEPGACVCEAIPSQIGSVVEYTPPAVPDPSSYGLPQAEDGTYLVTTAPGVELRIDPDLKDSLTALGACARWIVSCVSPPQRSLDDCFRSAPACHTNEPWLESEACCPAACFEQYELRRSDGLSGLLAFEQTLFLDRNCIPGLEALLGE